MKMFFAKKNNRISTTGFTLIELMVVVAIIAILATVVLIALSNARDAAEDSNKKTAIAQFRNIAAIYYYKNETYENMENSEEFQKIKEETDVKHNFQKETYCVTVKLSNNEWLCVDRENSLNAYNERRCAGGPNDNCNKIWSE